MSKELLKGGDPNSNEHREIDPNTGMQKDYVVLSEDERKSGFIRPVRRTYTHKKCGSDTRMFLAIAETYARNPKFYSATFCVQCKEHFPVAEFVWKDNPDQEVGS